MRARHPTLQDWITPNELITLISLRHQQLISSTNNVMFFYNTFIGLVAVSMATTCYVCTGSSCEDEYTGSSSEEINCTTTGYVEDGGCSKTKQIARVGSLNVQTSMIMVTISDVN